ncbi:MAG TPA: branched-chain amino acid ABC transporter substrate-binding protein [Propionibacteriaceae bacterium]
MRKQRLFIAGVTLLASTMAMTACGSRTAETPAGTAGETKTAKIGVIAPLTGDLSSLGLGIQNSVDLAIKQANDSNAIPGWKLELSAEDDEAKPDVGKNAATKLASDDEVVGVVGALNSSVSLSLQPVFGSANVVNVSPANTGPSLTLGPDYLTSKKRPYPTFFRTCTTDIIQGGFAATYLYNTAGVKKVATIHDKKTYGQGLVAAFTDEYKRLGGQVVAAETINPEDKDFSSVISKVKGANPDAVYYGGEFPQSGPLSQQAKAAGLNVPLMGGDGMYSPNYIKLAGKTSEGDLATSVGAPTETLASAKAFLDGYASGGYKDPYEAYGAQSYDAANAIINALKTSLASASDAKSARQATVDAMKSVSFDGATGPVSFDEFGDTKTKIVTAYKVTGGKWAPDKTEEFK